MPRVPYPTDLRDAEWAILEPALACVQLAWPTARRPACVPQCHPLRDPECGAQWRMVPRDLVPWGTAWSSKWDVLFRALNQAAVLQRMLRPDRPLGRSIGRACAGQLLRACRCQSAAVIGRAVLKLPVHGISVDHAQHVCWRDR